MLSSSEKPVILLTGASSGIGLSLARCLSTMPVQLIATARASSLGALEKEIPPSETVCIRELDVISEESRLGLMNEVLEQFGRVDVLINNAGISYRSVVEHMSPEDELLQLQTNYFGPMALIRAVLPGMRKRQSGRIINVSSVAGMMAMPTMGAYSASKFALEGASEALWYELKPWNVRVSLIQAGFVRSESHQRVYSTEAGRRAAEDPGDDYHLYYKTMSGFVEKLMGRSRATPEVIARKVIGVMQMKNPPLRVPVTADAHLFFWIRRILPRWMYHMILYRNLPGVKSWEASIKDHSKASAQ
jgi:short-subunit dehydrogenase